VFDSPVDAKRTLREVRRGPSLAAALADVEPAASGRGSRGCAHSAADCGVASAPSLGAISPL
jgi:hypothetical protein